ncbi:phytase [Marinibactrum halimedae]|uniref:BPP domain-containing protein n=1 Tax=Marinibactrum halimedae TaxID=1444977 RepID=A0AA37TEZ6_9GAMM|nr:phytase [Marinibactrum halimedae]MCD9461007.1 phytase [Marinibactrum halimedae]GLS27807.1 hypothetical protein GCM10007877_35260 [Marinibactrum halimedae]
MPILIHNQHTAHKKYTTHNKRSAFLRTAFYPFIGSAFLIFGLGGCTPVDQDSLRLPPSSAKVVYATIETTPVKSPGDAADDPAIWVHPTTPEKSLILGTDKRKGLEVYNLAGEQQQMIERGNVNNIDIRQQVMVDGKYIDIAVATNRTHNTLDMYTINANGDVHFLTSEPLDIGDPYGMCLHHHKEKGLYVFVNGKSGQYQQWQLTHQQKIVPKLVRKFNVTSTPEGCVADDENHILYFGEEDVGIWKNAIQYPNTPYHTHDETEVINQNNAILIDSVESAYLSADIEGMDIYKGRNTTDYLVVSSQGNHSYAVYALKQDHDKETDEYIGSIQVKSRMGQNQTIDGTEETDGLTVTSAYLGEAFPRGILVVQDGFNTQPEDNQNFKIIDWMDVIETLELKD